MSEQNQEPQVSGAVSAPAVAATPSNEPAAIAGLERKDLGRAGAEPKIEAAAPTVSASAVSRLSHVAQSRWGAPVAAAACAALIGWYGGAQSSALGLAKAQSVLAERAYNDQVARHGSALASVEQRLGSMEAAASESLSLQRSIDILARRLDEVGRSQTASAAQTTARLDKSDKDLAQKLDRLAERVERIEKQVSSPAAVSSITKAAPGSLPNKLPDLPDRPEASEKGAEKQTETNRDKALRSYVLREVFRGGALVEGRHGVMEVFPGADLPGAGRVRSVERREGKWVVVTSAGVISAD